MALTLKLRQTLQQPTMKLLINPWFMATLLITLLLTTPLWVLLSFLFEPTNANWAHLADTLLPDYIINSLWLMFGVTIGALLLGVPSAWLISQYQFPGKDVFHWALLLPLAMPAYIIAYTYTGLLEFEGPVQSYLRQFFAAQTVTSWFPEVRSLGGAVVMFSLVLYPYVYLLARAAFAANGQQLMNASRTLGCGPYQSFFKVALPMARPAIIAGLTLALMETLADFGTVQHFGVDTFTTGIYRTWTGFGDTTTTAQLSLLLLGFVLTLMLVEHWSRKKAQYFSQGRKSNDNSLNVLNGRQALIAILICSMPILFGFIVPGLQLLYWAFTTAEYGLNSEFIGLIWNSFYLAFITASLTLLLALMLAYANRLANHKAVAGISRFATLGYSIPGVVIAVAVIIPLAGLDQLINKWTMAQFDYQVGLILSGTLFALVFAYMFRFLSVALQSVDAGLKQVKPSLENSARTLGASRWRIIRQIHFPLLQTSLISAFILVFVEVLKELPTTLILRPFNFNTLSVRAYEMASDERLADAGLPALLIVATGIIPVILLSKLIGKPHG
ncbi:ABC transporter permease [Thiomicrorhabdus sediminis]|nr:iron ABC transporter permease [Thiomicrorhabdus sediminis]